MSGTVGARQALTDTAVRKWTAQLADVSARTALLFYRDLRAGTLSLDDADPAARESLLGTGTVRLSALFPADVLPERARRARTVVNKATENFEERGIRTLYVAWGLGSWTTDRWA